MALHPSVATHIHSNATLPSKAEGHSSERSASGLVPPSQLREDVQELADDFMDQVQAMRAQISKLLPEQPLSDHVRTLRDQPSQLLTTAPVLPMQESELQRLKQEVQSSNTAYADALARARE